MRPTRPMNDLRHSIPRPDINHGRDRGRFVELRTYQAIISRKQLWPKEVSFIRQSTVHEDQQGIDLVVVMVDKTRVFIQVKSSKKEAQKFRKSHPDIPVIIGTKPENLIFLTFIDIIRGATKC